MSRPIQKPPQKTKPDLEITPATKNQTEKLVVFLTQQLYKKIDEKAIDMFENAKAT